MVLATASGTRSTEESFAYLWFNAMARFHRVKDPETWQFTEEDVIAYLKSKVKQKTPIWKRIKIIQGIIWFRNHVRKSPKPPLEHLRQTLRDADALEREKQEDRPIEEVVGKINPRESDAIQALRRALRSVGHKNNTEKSYVQKVRAFMGDRDWYLFAHWSVALWLWDADQRVLAAACEGHRFRSDADRNPQF